MTTQPVTQKIAEAVNGARSARGISKNELATLIWPTISRTQLQRKLGGTTSFSIEELICIADVLDVPLADFLIIPAELKQAG
jgi:transcriptional regulator with XRE-family HTH domain